MRVAIHGAFALLAALAMSWSGLASANSLPDFTELVKNNTPAVVNISTTQTIDDRLQLPEGMPDIPEDHPFGDLLRRFLEENPDPRPFDARSLGSGFIISPDGYILTNYHVVADASEIVVRLADRREFIAELVGADERSDLALLKIDAEDLPVVEIGQSSELEVGEWVLAIGSPFGFEHSVTAGIVSAKRRSLPSENYVPFIQTDVAINPGNSGGPLFNLDGEVVGVNSHIYSRTGGFMGLSFAIPIELAMDVVHQLRATGTVARGWLGVLIQDVTRELAESFEMEKPTGALVAQVIPGSPADRAGLRAGDIIVEYDDRPVPTSGSLPPMVGRTPIDEAVPVTVIRDGETRKLQVTIGRLPEDPIARLSQQPTPPPGDIERLGLQVEPLSDARRRALGLPDDQQGVLVSEVTRGGAADEAGVRVGDVITALDHDPVENVAQFQRLAAALPAGETVPLLVYRKGGPRFLALAPPEAVPE